jgi:hypothetical protein
MPGTSHPSLSGTPERLGEGGKTMKNAFRGKGKFAEPETPFSPEEEEPVVRGKGHDKVVVNVDDDSDRPAWAMGNNELNPHSKGGGQPEGAGDMKGDLYGDLYVIVRNVWDGNGEPVLDGEGNEILIGSNDEPIFMVDGEIPEDKLDLVQEVEFSRLSVARSPDSVMEHALEEVLAKFEPNPDGTEVTVELDGAGRLVIDGATIDSPLENLALYQELMTTPADQWSDVVPLPDDFDVAALFGAAADKTTEITVDTVVYMNTILGVNDDGYFDFTTYEYDRKEKYDGTTIYWFEPDETDPTVLNLTEGSIYEAVFNSEPWGGVEGDPEVLDLSSVAPYVLRSTDAAGIDDFVQAADDARAVIDFLHSEIVVEPVEAEALLM